MKEKVIILKTLQSTAQERCCRFCWADTVNLHKCMQDIETESVISALLWHCKSAQVHAGYRNWTCDLMPYSFMILPWWLAWWALGKAILRNRFLALWKWCPLLCLVEEFFFGMNFTGLLLDPKSFRREFGRSRNSLCVCGGGGGGWFRVRVHAAQKCAVFNVDWGHFITIFMYMYTENFFSRDSKRKRRNFCLALRRLF